MKKFVFGVMPKKKVTVYDDGKITLEVKMFENGEINTDEIVKVFHKEATALENGEVYLSPDGENHRNSLEAPTGFIYSRKQASDVEEFLGLLESSGVEESSVAESSIIRASKERKQEKAERKIERNALKCTKCKSTDVQFMDNKRKSFSVGKAVAGTVLTGGIGAIAGFAGKKGKDRWHCRDCGNIFYKKAK